VIRGDVTIDFSLENLLLPTKISTQASNSLPIAFKSPLFDRTLHAGGSPG
jgi:hypothetical protein